MKSVAFIIKRNLLTRALVLLCMTMPLTLLAQEGPEDSPGAKAWTAAQMPPDYVMVKRSKQVGGGRYPFFIGPRSELNANGTFFNNRGHTSEKMRMGYHDDQGRVVIAPVFSPVPQGTPGGDFVRGYSVQNLAGWKGNDPYRGQTFLIDINGKFVPGSLSQRIFQGRDSYRFLSATMAVPSPAIFFNKHFNAAIQTERTTPIDRPQENRNIVYVSSINTGWVHDLVNFLNDSSYRTEVYFEVAALLLIFGGVWFYLRTRHKMPHSLAALLAIPWTVIVAGVLFIAFWVLLAIAFMFGLAVIGRSVSVGVRR